MTRRGQMMLERRIIPARDGLFALAQTFTGSDTRTLVTHDAFVLSQVEVLEGSLSFLYGVMSNAVVRRTSEIGIRMALGARGGNVLRMVLRESLRRASRADPLVALRHE